MKKLKCVYNHLINEVFTFNGETSVLEQFGTCVYLEHVDPELSGWYDASVLTILGSI